MSRAMTKSFKQHPLKMSLGIIINSAGVLALAAQL